MQLVQLMLIIGRIITSMAVILFQSSEILASLIEFTLFHALTDIPASP